MWVATQDLPRSSAHPFYTRLNQILDRHDFDGYVEGLRQRFYADEIGRPGPARLPWVGAAGSAAGSFDYFADASADPIEPHEAVFTWVLQRLADRGH